MEGVIWVPPSAFVSRYRILYLKDCPHSVEAVRPFAAYSTFWRIFLYFVLRTTVKNINRRKLIR